MDLLLNLVSGIINNRQTLSTLSMKDSIKRKLMAMASNFGGYDSIF